jgi:hypothetical protein
MRTLMSCLGLLLFASGCSVSVATGAAVSVGEVDEVEPLNNAPSQGTAAAWLVGARWWAASDGVFEKDGQWTIDVMLDLQHEPPAGEEVLQLDWLLDTVYESVHVSPGAPPVVRPVAPDAVDRFEVRERVDFRTTVRALDRRFQIPVELERKRGFQAGEYLVTVKHLGSGVTFGEPQRVLLFGVGTPAQGDGE